MEVEVFWLEEEVKVVEEKEKALLEAAMADMYRNMLDINDS